VPPLRVRLRFQWLHLDGNLQGVGRTPRAYLNQTRQPGTLRIGEGLSAASIAAHIRKDSKLVVIDTENAFKHEGLVGPDGESYLCELLLENDITLPGHPLIKSASDGRHHV
jgi:hypothetical protein